MIDLPLADMDSVGVMEFIMRFSDQIPEHIGTNSILSGNYPSNLQLKVGGRTHNIEFSDKIWARYIPNKVKILHDPDPQDPREWNEGSVMTCFHRSYSLGDKHDFCDPEELAEYLESSEDVYRLPLYFYNHSGITISTKPSGDRWDSGEVGRIYITKANAVNIWGLNPDADDFEAAIINNLESEVKTYNQYITGDVYGFTITDPDGEEVDSCWGFYGDDFRNNGMTDHIPKELQSQLKDIEVSYN